MSPADRTPIIPRSLKFPAVFLLASLFGSCSLGSSYVRLRFPMTSPPTFSVADFQELVLAGFVVSEPPAEVEVAPTIRTFLEGEMKKRSPIPVVARPVELGGESLPENEEFWKAAAGTDRRVLFLTGTVRFDQELRKALLEKDLGRRETPFLTEKVWDERKTFTLQTKLKLIDGSTGRAVFEKDYKEVASYTRPDYPAAFALFDLLQRLKIKLSRDLFGAERLQERYLLHQ